MDYSIGSVADLISGLKTPNKPKVVEKKVIVQKENNNVPEPNVSHSNQDTETHDAPKKKKKKMKKGKHPRDENDSQDQPQGKKKKRGELISDVVERYKNNLNKVQEGQSNTVDEDNKDGTVKPRKFNKNAERRIKNKQKQADKQAEDPELTNRTIFVGNVPLNAEKNDLKKLFKQYGPIESVRIRGIPVANPKTPKKVAAIKKEYHPDRNSVFAFIRFMNKEDAMKADKEDGTLFNEHRLRVQHCGNEDKVDESKAIFVGNLSFDVEEDELWKLFESCGPISSVRIVRDKQTMMGKGFAYVNFKESDAVQLALEMENIHLKNRELRVSLCNNRMAKKNKRKNTAKKINRSGRPKSNDSRRNVGNEWEKGDGNNIKKDFQGSRFPEKKKKNKPNRGLLEKKRLANKIAPLNKD